ncbi:hypothetical protein LINPERHAP1_LOCUS35110 [Linum perenne]
MSTDVNDEVCLSGFLHSWDEIPLPCCRKLTLRQSISLRSPLFPVPLSFASGSLSSTAAEICRPSSTDVTTTAVSLSRSRLFGKLVLLSLIFVGSSSVPSESP